MSIFKLAEAFVYLVEAIKDLRRKYKAHRLARAIQVANEKKDQRPLEEIINGGVAVDRDLGMRDRDREESKKTD